MGMFDTFAFSGIACPHCGKRGEFGFQTKLLDCSLHVWRAGDRLDSALVIERGMIPGCIASHDCSEGEDSWRSFFGDVVVIDGRVERVEGIRKEAAPPGKEEEVRDAA